MKHIKNKEFDYYKDNNGLYQGEYKSYKNGKLWIHCYYKDNKYHGIYKEYYDNGNLWNICNMVNGKEHGEDKYYNKDGSHKRSRYYNNGKEITKFIK